MPSRTASLVKLSLQTCLALLAFADVAVGGPSDLMKLLTISFACPTVPYEVHEGQNYYLKVHDRNEWFGDDEQFRVRTMSKQMIGSIRGINVQNEERIIMALFRDLGQAYSDGLTVRVVCKQDRKCIRSKFPDNPGYDGMETEIKLHTCSSSAANDIAFALQNLITQ